MLRPKAAWDMESERNSVQAGGNSMCKGPDLERMG
jgi:hypothetical protein